MNAPYNRHAGHSVVRLAALSDGIFVVAMPPLAIDRRLPAAALFFFSTRLRFALILIFRLSYGFAPGFRVTHAEESANSSR